MALKPTVPILPSDWSFVGQTITIKLPRSSNLLTHTLQYKLGSGEYVEIAKNVGTSYDFTIPKSWANSLTNAVEGSATIVCDTYDESLSAGVYFIGETTATLKWGIPYTNEFLPTIDSVSVVEAVDGIKQKFGGYVAYKSKLKVTSKATGAYSSTIKSYSTYIADPTGGRFVMMPGNPVTTPTLGTGGKYVVSVTATDSRGRNSDFLNPISVNVIDYISPVAYIRKAFRCDPNGTANPEGTSVSVTVTSLIAPVDNKNDKQFTLQWRKKGAPNWTDRDITPSGWEISLGVFQIDNLTTDNAYEIRVTAQDFFSTTNSNVITIPTGYVIIDYRKGGKGIAFGKVATTDGFVIGSKMPLSIMQCGLSFIQFLRSNESLFASLYGHPDGGGGIDGIALDVGNSSFTFGANGNLYFGEGNFTKPRTTKPLIKNVAAGWTVSVTSCLRKYGRCQLNLTCKPDVATGTGNITNVVLCELGDASYSVLTDITKYYLPAFPTIGISQDYGALAGISSAGVITLYSVANGPWAAGSAANIYFDYQLNVLEPDVLPT